tara:strand:+ start:881 stop:985 length:105 start_codon:yes stop_codon:yes gene_type:complete
MAVSVGVVTHREVVASGGVKNLTPSSGLVVLMPN